MATVLSDVETKVRYLIGEGSKSTTATDTSPDIFTYTSSSTFTLSESNVISISSVLVNDSEVDSSDYSYDSTTNKLTISSSLSSGDSIEVNYSFYPNFSQTEIQNYVRAALIHISANNYKTFIVKGSSNTIYPEPSDREINLIAMVASLLIKPDNKSYRLPDVSIGVPKDLPTQEKINRTIQIFKKDTHGIFGVL